MATKTAITVEVRPIIIRRVKKVVSGGHHGGAWKVAYADFVTAMMAFFMLLWLIASPDKQRLKGLAQYFSPSSASMTPGESVDSVTGDAAGLGGQRQRAQATNPKANGRPSSDAKSAGSLKGGTASVPDASLRVMAEELKLILQPTSTPDNATHPAALEKSREGLRISLMDDQSRSMFRGRTAILNPYARQLLGLIARKIGRSSVQLAIEGHTDAYGGQSAANWKLSSDRALAAREALISSGITPDRFSEVVALGATQPVYPDQPSRPENRRVTIVLLAEGSPLPTDSSFRF